jgi:hypothetical protein
MNSKLAKIFAGTLTNGEKVINDYKILFIIIDFLPLKSLMRASRASK